MIPTDRPRYRALAAPWYDHAPDERPYHPDGAGHDRDGGCATGYELTIYRVDGYWRLAGGDRAHEPLGVTQTTGPLDLDAVVEAVRGWLRLAAEPHRLREPIQVEVYVRTVTT